MEWNGGKAAIPGKRLNSTGWKHDRRTQLLQPVWPDGLAAWLLRSRSEQSYPISGSSGTAQYRVLRMVAQMTEQRGSVARQEERMNSSPTLP